MTYVSSETEIVPNDLYHFGGDLEHGRNTSFGLVK